MATLTIPPGTAASVSATDPSKIGQWSDKMPLPNVPIHTHLLPTGKVLFWGRRNPPGTPDYPSLNQRETHPFIWDPAEPQTPAKPTKNQPTDSQGKPINLFCSGHSFLADGRLLVTGGHLFDSQGLSTSTFYDPFKDQWTAGPTMNNGRWYPTAVTLADGKAFVCSGSFPTGPLQPPLNANTVNNVSQILENGSWINLTDFTGLPLYPRFHVAPSGALFMAGSLATTYLFQDFEGKPGTWIPIAGRSAGNSDYAPSVMYDAGKIVFIGGGAPTNIVEVIDLNAPKPAWAVVAPMRFRRRQHNATLLADGTVLVTGGTQGGDFDNLVIGQPIRAGEIWDPATGTWTLMAEESVDRCYHSTAVLLPDGRVFSGGGGEYAPVVGVDQSNPPINTHADAQIFSPPYLFKGDRPTVSKAPAKVVYGQKFSVETPAPNEISMITWIRLGSVTHSFNQNQRINFPAFQRGTNQITVTAPANGNVCPPGHYMLFLLNQKKVPSKAAIIQITAAEAPALSLREAATASTRAAAPFRVLAAKVPTPVEEDAAIQKHEANPAVVVGVTPTCPYGISACWGGAYEALKSLHGVRLVRPIPNAEDSTAHVYLEHGGLPDLDLWRTQFATVANGTHILRGVEVTVAGVVDTQEPDTLIMRGNDTRPPLHLESIVAADKVQWDATTRAAKPLDPLEQNAYATLAGEAKNAGGSFAVTVTGPLKKAADGYALEVRRFSAAK
jgi:galactose oxidase